MIDCRANKPVGPRMTLVSRGDGDKASNPVSSDPQPAWPDAGHLSEFIAKYIRITGKFHRYLNEWHGSRLSSSSPPCALAQASQLSSNWTFNLQYLLARSDILWLPFWTDSERDWFSGLIVTVIGITKPKVARVQNYNKKSYSNPESLSNKLYFYWIFSIENSLLSDQINSLRSLFTQIGPNNNSLHFPGPADHFASLSDDEILQFCIVMLSKHQKTVYSLRVCYRCHYGKLRRTTQTFI